MERFAYGSGIPGQREEEETVPEAAGCWNETEEPGGLEGIGRSRDEDEEGSARSEESPEDEEEGNPDIEDPAIVGYDEWTAHGRMRLRSPFEDWTMKRIGQEGERVAAKFLEQLGFTILERNWMRAGREADIIAFRDETVVFVEVKTTVASPYDPDIMPELRVDDRKKAKYRTIAGMYLQAHPGYPNARFDVIAVNLVEPGHSRLVHLEGAFTCDQI